MPVFFDTDTRSIPGYVGVELMAQSVASWSGYHAWKRGKSSPVGFLLGCRRYQVECSVFKEHQVLDIYAEQVIENNGMAVFGCRIEHHASCSPTASSTYSYRYRKNWNKRLKRTFYDSSGARYRGK